jgi:hypothetical protein
MPDPFRDGNGAAKLIGSTGHERSIIEDVSLNQGLPHSKYSDNVVELLHGMAPNLSRQSWAFRRRKFVGVDVFIPQLIKDDRQLSRRAFAHTDSILAEILEFL